MKCLCLTASLRKPLKKGGCQCKMGFPRKVLPKVRPRVVCPGIAPSLGLQCSGRRNALGSIAGSRRCPSFSATSRILSKLHKSNTNVQLPYRVPLLEATHDPECTSDKCLSEKNKRRLFLIGQRAVKQMTGYFGGYISKRQKIGRFELKQSIAAQSYFVEKLQRKNAVSFANGPCD